MEIQQAIYDKLSRIEAYLYFDKETNTPGLVERVHALEKQVEDLKEDNSVKKKVWATFGAIGGAVVMVIIEIIKWMAHNNK